MRLQKVKVTKEKRLSWPEAKKLAKEIQQESRKELKLPEDFDVVKFIHQWR